MIFDGNGIQGQHARLNADRSIDLFFQGDFVGFQLIRVKFQLCEPHDAVFLRF
jgi:hypothetical protein